MNHHAQDSTIATTTSENTSVLSVAAMTDTILAYLRFKKAGYERYLSKLMGVNAHNYYSISWLDGEIARVKRLIGCIGILEHQCSHKSVSRMLKPMVPSVTEVLDDESTAFPG